jgi:hypothetical protein
MTWKPTAMAIRARRNVMRDTARTNTDMSSEEIERAFEGYDRDIGHPGAGRRWWRESEGDLCSEVERVLKAAGLDVKAVVARNTGA